MNTELIAILVGFSLMAFALAAVALGIACLAWSTVVGLKNSTHQIQYVPIGEDVNDEGKESLQDRYDKAHGFKYEEDEYV
jgi:hypothetical protein